MKRKDIRYIFYAIAAVAAAIGWLELRCMPASYVPILNWLIERTN